MGIIVIIIVAGVILLFIYQMLVEYLSNTNIRPVYYIFLVIFAIMVLAAMCTGGGS